MRLRGRRLASLDINPAVIGCRFELGVDRVHFANRVLEREFDGYAVVNAASKGLALEPRDRMFQPRQPDAVRLRAMILSLKSGGFPERTLCPRCMRTRAGMLADPRFFSSRAINAVQKFAFSSSIRAPRPASRRDLLEIKNLIVEGYRRAD